ncbi:hypothetical protein NDA11_006198 [Ustilago hordei]|nr:hypothetical protein NDA10_002712 [Ustilago hordei]KAJ1583898.1 hypothetical protein NDA15_007741 [Ustilago hordei]KAJ1586813.1 hypothetical protein NDA11_006198 [Ustilago hordei]KAJ1591894.1 hypothetical protein NDA12_003771 [Ustilago hordei]KAJ1603343.1 hypothetical protein NDA14_005782 [Ustilago hordei]
MIRVAPQFIILQLAHKLSREFEVSHSERSAQKTLDRHSNARCARNAKSVESRASDQFYEPIRPISQVASRKDATDALGLMRLHETEGTVVGGSSPLLMANRDLREEVCGGESTHLL